MVIPPRHPTHSCPCFRSLFECWYGASSWHWLAWRPTPMTDRSGVYVDVGAIRSGASECRNLCWKPSIGGCCSAALELVSLCSFFDARDLCCSILTRQMRANRFFVIAASGIYKLTKHIVHYVVKVDGASIFGPMESLPKRVALAFCITPAGNVFFSMVHPIPTMLLPSTTAATKF